MTPTSNRIRLDRALVDAFLTFKKNISDNTIAMAEKAFDIRSQYLSSDSRKYDPKFEEWWSEYNLDSVFGGRANFTKYAASGKVVEQAKIGGYTRQIDRLLIALAEA